MTTHSGSAIVDETLGTFVRGHHILSDGVRLDDDYFSLTRNIDGRDVGFIAHSVDSDAVRGMLPRLHHVFDQLQRLHRQAAEAVVYEFSEDPTSTEELDDALRDLALDAVEVFPDNEVVLDLADTCGSHFMDGYWPAVRFNGDDNVVKVTVES
ncbi:hypothetical protein CJ178_14025 [Rhodococcus sp. ACPA4]|uniref:hypothetical protein n=1 Tax=Rhodococcus TaxID=1827 RepID=UPI0005DF2D71|nr:MULTISPECIES: hypothetical protein [Rhodococcus]KJF23645.1 hypothetical protein SZ00_00562 [Rhodococcus sp. AD45]MDV8069094.1 hypothetical protein [Rhodococcus sp. IEGM 1366]PBC42558.1 hypothetical protein CJ178_14025 [Rhodococcus sp. ACPA4]PSR42057.1 hypothetical protein C7T36_07495 [Rhodococcus sp. AD45-ID]QXW04820.1 hypothetical protein KYT97_12845 [Rhodococcus globerulus]